MAKGSLRGINGAKRTDLFTMNPLDIEVKWEDNPRYDYGTEEEWEEFKNSIRTEGVKNPIQVYLDKSTGQVYLAQGYRRMKAISELITQEGVTNLKSIKVELIEFDEQSILKNHYTQNNTGKPLNEVELGELLNKIKKLSGKSMEEIAKNFGMTGQKVNKLITYAKEGSSYSKELVKKKMLSLSQAMSLARQANGSEAQNRVLKKANKEMKKSGSHKIKPEHLFKSGMKTIVHTVSLNQDHKGSEEKNTNLQNIKRAIAYALTSQDENYDIDMVEKLESVVEGIENNMSTEELQNLFLKKMETV